MQVLNLTRCPRASKICYFPDRLLVGLDLNLGFRGVTRGPKVVVVSPAPDAGMVHSPFKLRLKFEAHGGASIDPQRVKMVYLKNPSVNLTQRIGELIKRDGLEVDDAQTPPASGMMPAGSAPPPLR
jgi:hypothetical protein